MELEEALQVIETLKGENATLKTENEGLNTKLTDTASAHEKELQASFNKGYDKAKNKFEGEVGDGYIKKEDVEKMLSERERGHTVEKELLRLGVKNPDRAAKLIDEEDLLKFGGEDFNEEDFMKKYGDDIVFAKPSGEEANGPKDAPSNFTKNNDKQEQPLTAESYAELSPAEQAKIPMAEKLALL